MSTRADRLVVVSTILAVSLAAVAVQAGAPQPANKGEAKPPAASFVPPPESLRALYPPQAARQEYTLQMLELGRLMGVAIQETYEGSPDAASRLAAFRESYEKTASLVPEWKEYFPSAPIEELTRVVETEKGLDPAEAKKAAKAVEQVCTRCHTLEMPKVQALYDWQAFDQVTVPANGKGKVTFHDVMIQLSTLLAGLEASAEKKNFEQASASFEALDREFGHLETACMACHEEPREYFVDKRIKGRLYRLGGLVRQKVEDTGRYRKEVDEIYEGSCIPCHHIHMPPAFIQMQLLDQGVSMP